MEVYSTLQDNGICIYDTMKAYIMTATGEHLKYSTSKPRVQHLCVASYQARRSLVYVTVSLCVYRKNKAAVGSSLEHSHHYQEKPAVNIFVSKRERELLHNTNGRILRRV